MKPFEHKEMRLDVFLRNAKLLESREQAQSAIKQGYVTINGRIIKKPSHLCNELDNIIVSPVANKYVSRGALKLEKALSFFDFSVKNRTGIDVGASTGGFTDLLLQSGAKKIYCIDVGNCQLHPKIREDSRVVVYENTDFRNIDNKSIIHSDFAVVDVSFISSTKLIEKFRRLTNIVEIILLLKPQFECGKSLSKRFKGIINSRIVHFETIKNVMSEWTNSGFVIENLISSPICGGDGNIEYFLKIARLAKNSYNSIDISAVIDYAFDTLKK